MRTKEFKELVEEVRQAEADIRAGRAAAARDWVAVRHTRVIRETERAMLLGFRLPDPGGTGHGELQVWLPKSLCAQPEPGVIEIPRWLAVEKGLG